MYNVKKDFKETIDNMVDKLYVKEDSELTEYIVILSLNTNITYYTRYLLCS